MFDPAAFKPVLSALALPPTPFLVLALIGARCATGRRRGVGFLLVLVACIGIWLSGCMGTAQWLQDGVLKPPPALGAADHQRLASLARDRRVPNTVPAAIWVLGGGRQRLAEEYGAANLTVHAMARLRYGIWLARATGLPLGFTGGVGWAQGDTVTEADTAAAITQQEAGMPMRWRETTSRDTRENAAHSLPMLRAAGVREVVLVTHAAHMPRALRAFTEAAAATPGEPMRITPAPMAFITADDDRPLLRWMPSTQGYTSVYNLLHEGIGLLAGR